MPKVRQALTEKEAGWEEAPPVVLHPCTSLDSASNRGACTTLHAYHPIGGEVNAE